MRAGRHRLDLEAAEPLGTEIVIRADVMGDTLDQHAPARARGLVPSVNFERHDGLRCECQLRPGGGLEDDDALVEHKVDREDQRLPGRGDDGDPAESLRPQVAQALVLRELSDLDRM